ncbi:DNA adenine methylase [Corynebacterium sp. CCM 9185]|uniref:site-specific DNA-methyltransferase (adenine-specific) n=1 Tax=Corynebacterium marambiense TaxID=2765364 RepID=A0ABS0VSK3_9CORY|nr:DNA adenine methylase [Corynebacterium marambiense]MBI8999753.1 DNA adenine methylase [Corynebacterium marambiense]MCK7662593.1 DNA adenine methylase [Corynebacterium marambiense]
MRQQLPIPLFSTDQTLLSDALQWAHEGIKYAGSKQKLLAPIFEAVKDIPCDSVLDLFSGTTRVSRLFAGIGSSVASNDLAEWSECFATAYLLNDREASAYQPLIDHLNSLTPIDGWFTQNYGGIDYEGSAVQQNGKKALWQRHNTMKLDAVREEIDRLSLTPLERSIALTSLIYALDRVENTIGHYVSYLKRWSPRSYNQMTLQVPNLRISNRENFVFREDAETLLDHFRASGKHFDLAYLDPPYGSNNEKMPPSRVRYASYYHIWKTVILNDRPEIFGAAHRREDSRDKISASPFEEYRRDEEGSSLALKALHRVVKKTPAEHLLLSYSNGGRATYAELVDVLADSGELITAIQMNYKKNVMANMTWTNQWIPPEDIPNVEYLFLIRK